MKNENKWNCISIFIYIIDIHITAKKQIRKRQTNRCISKKWKPVNIVFTFYNPTNVLKSSTSITILWKKNCKISDLSNTFYFISSYFISYYFILFYFISFLLILSYFFISIAQVAAEICLILLITKPSHHPKNSRKF